VVLRTTAPRVVVAAVIAVVGAWASRPPLASAEEYFVGPDGDDSVLTNTRRTPFATVQRGVDALGTGDVLTILAGSYAGRVKVRDKHTILIRGDPTHGGRPTLDGSLLRYRVPGRTRWTRILPSTGVEEYQSVATFPDDPVNRGAFVDGRPYTRLITYSRHEDLVARNELFGPIFSPDDPRPGPPQTTAQGKLLSPPRRVPWVYMGPGLWWDSDTGRVHIRLSATHNHVPGLRDYTGQTDPRRVRLAISARATTTLAVSGSDHVRFEHLRIAHGGENTIRLASVGDVSFDHVEVRASSIGVRTSAAHGTTFTDSVLTGGLPPWYFRSDHKAEYSFRQGTPPVTRVRRDELGKQTQLALFRGHGADAGTHIATSELVDAHDVYLGGSDIEFAYNWLNDINDEALLVDDVPTENLKVHDNVITKSLSAISFAGARRGDRHFFFRNLIDLRTPIASHRPRCPGDTAVWKHGHLLKSNGFDGPYDLFHNTVLVADQEDGAASFTHYRNARGERRRSFNNIFVAVNDTLKSDESVALLPRPGFPGPTDGNDYVRVGRATKPAFRVLLDGGDVLDFDDRGALRASDYFTMSKAQYAPGYEHDGIEGAPGFRSFAADGAPRGTDDLRVTAGSPAGRGGVALPVDLRARDSVVSSDPRHPGIGRYPAGAGALRVGVDRRRAFPGSATPGPAPIAGQGCPRRPMPGVG
jgi:hypothetical protein